MALNVVPVQMILTKFEPPIARGDDNPVPPVSVTERFEAVALKIDHCAPASLVVNVGNVNALNPPFDKVYSVENSVVARVKLVEPTSCVI
jgi:hypothetical protein